MEPLKGKEYLRSNTSILRFAIKKWKLLIGVAIVAGGLATVFSGPQFISPKYTSFAAIYPANLGAYADETELQQMQQYLGSTEIREAMIEKFNLYEEYKIDSSIMYAQTYVNAVYSEHVKFEETRFESIILTCISTDPVKARDMVSELIDLLNGLIRKTEREKYREIVKINKQMLDQKRAQLDSLEKLSKELSVKYGVLDYVAQSEEITEGYVSFLLNGKKGSDFDEMKKMYENTKKYGRYYQDIQEQLFLINEEYMERLHNYEQAVKNVLKYQTYSNVLVKPQVSDKKSSPIRWLIAIVSVVSAVGFTFVMLLIFGFQNRD